MSNTRKIMPPYIPSDIYTREYFEHWCHGSDEFRISYGQILPMRLIIPLKLARIRPGDFVLDIGCGRGELALHCAQHGAWVWAIDYALPALELASEALSHAPSNIHQRVKLIQADARFIPIPDETIDVAFMIDVVEHLTPIELNQSLQEIRRVLKPNGKLIVHTMPNLWYYAVGYPIYRTIQALRGVRLPIDPRDRWPFKEVHINEQTPLSLWQTLRRNGFQTIVFLKNTQSYKHERSRIFRFVMVFLANFPVINIFFCNDIFAIARKR